MNNILTPASKLHSSVNVSPPLHSPSPIMLKSETWHRSQSPSSKPHSSVLYSPPSHVPSPILKGLGALQLGYFSLNSMQSPPEIDRSLESVQNELE